MRDPVIRNAVIMLLTLVGCGIILNALPLLWRSGAYGVAILVVTYVYAQLTGRR